VPYVSCPSCEQVTLTRVSRRGPELCVRCGEPLPLKRTVVPLSRYRALTDERPPEPEPVAA
jgi:hypothetical protein